MTPSPHRATIVALASRDDGATLVDFRAALPQMTSYGLRNLLTRMLAGGALHHDYVGSPRWFASAEQAQQAGQELQRPGEMKRVNARSDGTRKVLERAAAGGITNYDLQALLGVTGKRASSLLADYERRGVLFKGHPAPPSAWFLTDAEAQADREHPAQRIRRPKARPTVQRRPNALQVKPEAPKPASASRNPKPLPKPIPLPNTRATASQGPAIVPPHVKVQVLPSSPTWGRHALPPDTRVLGGFATMGIGRYIEESRA